MRPFSRRFLALQALVVALLVGFVAQAGFAQSQTTSSLPPPVRDAQAIVVLQAAITAMGGTSAVAAISDATVIGTEQDIPNPSGPPATFTWQSSGSEFRSLTQNSNGPYIALSGHGTPGQQKHGNWIPWPYHVARAHQPFYLPAVVLYAELQNPNYALSYIGSVTADGKSAIKIHTFDASDNIGPLVTPQDWYFDPTSFLPLRVEYLFPYQDDANHASPLSMEFANFQSVSGILVPYQLQLHLISASTTATVTSATFNTGLSSSTFDPPSGGGQ
jgi:hypothetical protein